jgi:ribosomal protein S16
VPIDGKPSEENCIAVKEILETLKNCKRKVLVFDCCRTERDSVDEDRNLEFFQRAVRFGRQEPHLTGLYMDKNQNASTVLWFSTSPYQSADDGVENSPFIVSWLEAHPDKRTKTIETALAELFETIKVYSPTPKTKRAIEVARDRILYQVESGSPPERLKRIRSVLEKTGARSRNKGQSPHFAILAVEKQADSSLFTAALHMTQNGIGVGGGYAYPAGDRREPFAQVRSASWPGPDNKSESSSFAASGRAESGEGIIVFPYVN